MVLEHRIAKELQDANTDLIADAQTRLEQALYFLREFRQREVDFHEKNRAMLATTPDSVRLTLAEDVTARGALLKLHGEAFYYFAWRASQALKRLAIRVDAAGIRKVRNQMIEHLEKPNGLLVSAWMFSSRVGMVLQSPDDLDPSGFDHGLYPNAQEFVDKLLAKAEKQLGTPHS